MEREGKSAGAASQSHSLGLFDGNVVCKVPSEAMHNTVQRSAKTLIGDTKAAVCSLIIGLENGALCSSPDVVASTLSLVVRAMERMERSAAPTVGQAP